MVSTSTPCHKASQGFYPEDFFAVVTVIVEVYFLWNRTVDSLKTSLHPLLWTSSGPEGISERQHLIWGMASSLSMPRTYRGVKSVT